MKILHLISGKIGGVRLQRYINSNYNNNHIPIILAPVRNSFYSGDPRTIIWSKCKTYFYGYNKYYRNMIPFFKINLKKIFDKEKCDLVHAHNIENAFYSKRLGIPTVYDDYEFNIKYSELRRILNYNNTHLLNKAIQIRIYRKRIKAIQDFLKSIPIIVTNDAVKEYYEKMGGNQIWVVPNVPVKKEVDYALKFNIVKKDDMITTCYIGDLTFDENSFLRCTKGVKELWRNNDIGKLYVFEGFNMVPHLEIMGIIRRFHFNLLFWKPLKVHKYYLQNKAFLASAMEIPTIISSSLKSTIKLLRDYALVVDSLEEIPEVIINYNYEKLLSKYADQYFSFYEDRIDSAYEASIC